MALVLLARNPTESVTWGLLPAAGRLGLEVHLLTDDPAAHEGLYPPRVRVTGCDVTDVRAVLALLDARGERPEAVASNSDHLQTQTALVADYLGRPGKDWRSALRARDKGLMRRRLRDTGLDDTPVRRISPGDGPPTGGPYPSVLKPAEGVASEDVVMVRDDAELADRLAAVRTRRNGDLVLEGFLEGPLHTLETLGDGTDRRVWGGYRTQVSPAPHFIEERLTWDVSLPPAVTGAVLAMLDALGVGFGPSHTEFIVTDAGPRLVEVNDRLIGDHCDFAMADLIGEPVFDDVLRVFLGQPLPRRAPGPARHGFVHWVLADRDGTLVSAPSVLHGPAFAGDSGGVLVDYRPMRALGTSARLTGTNRDYLGALRVVGPDPAAVDAAAAAFLADRRWVIE